MKEQRDGHIRMNALMGLKEGKNNHCLRAFFLGTLDWTRFARKNASETGSRE
jgi:hypothetical protein